MAVGDVTFWPCKLCGHPAQADTGACNHCWIEHGGMFGFRRAVAEREARLKSLHGEMAKRFSAPQVVVMPVLYVDELGHVHRARTLEVPNLDDRPTKILVGRGARIDVVEAKYSKAQEPGTWSRVLEPAT